MGLLLALSIILNGLLIDSCLCMAAELKDAKKKNDCRDPKTRRLRKREG